MRALVLHAYSASNLGDGLLVAETIKFVRDVAGSNVEITVLASHPTTFSDLDVKVINSAPTKRGFSLEYLRALWRMNTYNLVVSVGGGYLRSGTPIEALKAGIIHGPQLLAAAFRTGKAVYLPQSLGPSRFGTQKLLMPLLSRQHAVWVRDDRSRDEFPLRNAHRVPDLAILGMERSTLDFAEAERTVLTVRYIRGELTAPVKELSALLGDVDSFVQSSVASNNDGPAVQELSPKRILSSDELMLNPSQSRVVIAIRLHAALMAIAAGHFVIHLAYERKGFGAFQDLGISEFVFNVNNFDPHEVAHLARRLQNDPGLRQNYHERVVATRLSSETYRENILSSLQASLSS